ncbi:MAG: DNA adenine methylase, partial [Candidatus Celaenobacter polaris]|nr:DNA adenine methylase [Candidatus Celaenobacter polaris]
MKMESESIVINRPRKFYSPLRYPGGKASLSTFLFNIIDCNHIINCTYIEPYAGGAGAALTLLFLEKVDQIIINDLDKSIYAFWKAILNCTERFIQKTWDTDVSIAEWHNQRQVYKDECSSEFDRGFATFFLNRTNRSGIIEGGPIGGMKQKGNWKINARFNKENLIERIKKIALYKSRIQIMNLDGIDLMRQVYDMPNILVYIDPPYCEKGSLLYLNHYNESNHMELAEFLNNNNEFYWLLTYDNVPKISAMYSDRKIV